MSAKASCRSWSVTRTYQPLKKHRPGWFEWWGADRGGISRHARPKARQKEGTGLEERNDVPKRSGSGCGSKGEALASFRNKKSGMRSPPPTLFRMRPPPRAHAGADEVSEAGDDARPGREEAPLGRSTHGRRRVDELLLLAVAKARRPASRGGGCAKGFSLGEQSAGVG